MGHQTIARVRTDFVAAQDSMSCATAGTYWIFASDGPGCGLFALKIASTSDRTDLADRKIGIAATARFATARAVIGRWSSLLDDDGEAE